MTKKRKQAPQARRVSGNPAVRAQQLRDEQLQRQLAAADRAFVPPRYRSPTREDWDRLHDEALQVHPECLDCGSPMQVVEDSGEEGQDDEWRTVISTVLICSASDDYDPDDFAAEEEFQAQHPGIGGGSVEHELILS